MSNKFLTFQVIHFLKFRSLLVKILPRSIKIILVRFIGIVQQSRIIRFVVPQVKVLGDWGSIANDRDTVLVVSHEGSRTGAPILSYNLVQNLLKKYNVVALFLGPGPMLDACHTAGAIVVGPLMLRWSESLSDLAIKQIMDASPIKFALINSIESRYVLPALYKYNVATVSLIHEFAAYTRPRNAFYETVFWSGQIVFSTQIIRDNMIEEYPDLGVRDYLVIPQGRCVLPAKDSHEKVKESALSVNINRAMRPKTFADDGIIFIGVGSVQFRKGVDLFIECAASILRKAPNLPFRFVWVGAGYDPENEVLYSVYLADQVRRAGLDTHVQFLDEVTDLDSVYKSADILILSSRLDPLPNVAIDALANGLPVVCFDKNTGIAPILSRYGLGDECVATYLSVEDMACKALALAQSKVARDRVSKQVAKLADKIFRMDQYVDQIEQLAFKEVDRIKQKKLDANTITNSAVLVSDYYRSLRLQYKSQNDDIRFYLRSWATGVYRRKLFPGFHPGIYLEQHGVGTVGADPLADYLRAGKPHGPWNFELITSNDEVKPISSKLRIGLHIHAYYLDIFPEILERLKKNNVRPDLLISVTSESARMTVTAYLEAYEAKVDIRVLPNHGRDIGPFLTGFKETIQHDYDLIGHLHTKKTVDLEVTDVGRDWYQFLLENLLGGKAAMADVILGRMAYDKNVMMVFPDDPYIVGWGGNYKFAESLGIKSPCSELNFPVGTMFWARPSSLKPLFDLNLSWGDYPEEPLPYDGSLLHAIERSLGIFATQSGGSILVTNVVGVTR